MRIISGIFGGRKLKTDHRLNYRPATGKVRGAIFSMLEDQGLDWHTLHVLDVFAGSGSLAIEALSRGAVTALFLENNVHIARLIKENLLHLGLPSMRWRVLCKDALAVLSRPPKQNFSLVFVDPPYHKGLLVQALRSLGQKKWIHPGGFVLAEAEAGLVMPVFETMGLELLTDRLYGQTRILLCQNYSNTT